MFNGYVPNMQCFIDRLFVHARISLLIINHKIILNHKLYISYKTIIVKELPKGVTGHVSRISQ